MLPLSNLSIKLNKSYNYFILLTLVNIFTLVLLYFSGVHWLFFGLSLLVLFYQIIKISFNMLPHPNLLELNYAKKVWSIKLLNGKNLEYEAIKIRMDAGFFMIIAFVGGNKLKNLVVFYDQISNHDRKMLFIFEKMNNLNSTK